MATLKKKESTRRKADKEVPAVGNETKNEETERIKAETDALLDEIDELLGTEEECAAAVASYVQRGGE